MQCDKHHCYKQNKSSIYLQDNRLVFVEGPKMWAQSYVDLLPSTGRDYSDYISLWAHEWAKQKQLALKRDVTVE